MTWLKQNWFKIVIVLLFLAFGLYYLVIVLSAQNLDAKITNCRILGEEYRKNEIKENPSISFFVPRYAYNKDMNICIYSGGFIDDKLLNKYIIDLNTNTTIKSSYYLDNKLFEGLTSDEFKKAEAEFFNGQ